MQIKPQKHYDYTEYSSTQDKETKHHIKLRNFIWSVNVIGGDDMRNYFFD